MEHKDYWTRDYRMSVTHGPDTLTVEKMAGSDWSSVQMKAMHMLPNDITIRSREMAEQLHFMLGQMLGK